MGRRLNDPEVADTYNAALDHEAAGEIELAVAAYERLLELDPEDHGGARVRLAGLRHGEAPERAADAYVETLFDQCAEQFEDVLVDALQYRVPALMRERLDALKLGPFARMLDLGCGTGLAAEAMADRTREIIGLDISSRMIDLCEDKDIYDGLYVAEIGEFLVDNDEERFDFVSACDVLPYLGDLTPFFSGVAANMVAGGIFAFSSETLPGADLDGAPYMVASHHRFVHSAGYVRKQLAAAGFDVLEFGDINVRMQAGEPTPGFLVLARLSA